MGVGSPWGSGAIRVDGAGVKERALRAPTLSYNRQIMTPLFVLRTIQKSTRLEEEHQARSERSRVRRTNTLDGDASCGNDG